MLRRGAALRRFIPFLIVCLTAAVATAGGFSASGCCRECCGPAYSAPHARLVGAVVCCLGSVEDACRYVDPARFDLKRAVASRLRHGHVSVFKVKTVKVHLLPHVSAGSTGGILSGNTGDGSLPLYLRTQTLLI